MSTLKDMFTSFYYLTPQCSDSDCDSEDCGQEEDGGCSRGIHYNNSGFYRRELERRLKEGERAPVELIIEDLDRPHPRFWADPYYLRKVLKIIEKYQYLPPRLSAELDPSRASSSPSTESPV